MSSRFTHIHSGIGAALITLALLPAGPAAAHQTYLISDLYVLRPGTDNFLVLKNGTYHESGYSITRKMSRDISIVMGGERKEPGEGEVADVSTNPSYKSTYIKVVAEKEGTALAGLAAHPDYIALPTEMFTNYLKHEGMTDALEAFQASNKLSTIRERYTKHAKAIFQVGKPLTDDFKHKLDYKAEIFVEQNPGAVKVGDEMSIVVLFEGKPLVNQQVYVSHATFPEPPKADIPELSAYSLRTDQDGRAKFKITTKDKWYVQLIHMQKVDDEDADYESNWSTITFEIK
ncbi:MAG: DUF4198 domain-containing protein [Gammaproteobacteria bacterium]|nr:DUF4198 domain-containing protein [Gammaproteobacteria bacterium]